MIKKVCNWKMDEIDEKVVDTLGGWDKTDEKVGEVGKE